MALFAINVCVRVHMCVCVCVCATKNSAKGYKLLTLCVKKLQLSISASKCLPRFKPLLKSTLKQSNCKDQKNSRTHLPLRFVNTFWSRLATTDTVPADMSSFAAIVYSKWMCLIVHINKRLSFDWYIKIINVCSKLRINNRWIKDWRQEQN